MEDVANVIVWCSRRYSRTSGETSVAEASVVIRDPFRYASRRTAEYPYCTTPHAPLPHVHCMGDEQAPVPAATRKRGGANAQPRFHACRDWSPTGWNPSGL